MGPDAEREELCERLRDLRRRVFGERGRATFSRALGVSPSTYNYYEKGRPPPADLLARAAEVTGASLEWLLTGRGEPFPAPARKAGDTQLSQPLEEVLGRFSEAVGRGANAAAARASLQALLARMEQAFPGGPAAWQPCAFEPGPTHVPIVGRTAAGLPARWEEFFAGKEDPQVLEDLIARLGRRAGKERAADLARPDPQQQSQAAPGGEARLVQLSEPTPEGIAEFVDLPWLEAAEPSLFGLRVDGDSMAPRIRDGDIVLARRDEAPLPGQTAVAKLRGRIGVTVKLWRPEGDRVHLVPINEAYDPTVCPRSDVLWACRVVWVVRV